MQASWQRLGGKAERKTTTVGPAGMRYLPGKGILRSFAGESLSAWRAGKGKGR